MNPLRGFDEFLRDGTVKKQSPNRNRAESLIREAESKRLFMETVLKNTPKEKIYPNFIIESCYDIVLERVRARMLLEGYSSDSHEAEVSYMRELGFPEFDVRLVNELRYFRNGIKYYGRILDREYSQKMLEFMKRIYPKLEKLSKAAD